ncbi:MAG: ABC transporter permease subunit [bacterium]
MREISKEHKHVKNYHRRSLLSYPATPIQKFYTFLLSPLITVLLMYLVFKFLPNFLYNRSENFSFFDLIEASFATLGRLIIAYILAVVVAFPLAILAVYNRFFEAILLPVFDIIESVPVLAIFPIVILLFVRFGMLNSAAIFILFLSMLWNIVFTLVGGLKIIPKDITYAAKVFGITKLSYFKKVILPGVFPELVTGSILAFAQGWNLTIVAEALHTYIPGGLESDDLFGIGSFLVHASSGGNGVLFISSVLVMVVLIAIMNLLVWQRLLHHAERFRFE